MYKKTYPRCHWCLTGEVHWRCTAFHSADYFPPPASCPQAGDGTRDDHPASNKKRHCTQPIQKYLGLSNTRNCVRRTLTWICAEVLSRRCKGVYLFIYLFWEQYCDNEIALVKRSTYLLDMKIHTSTLVIFF